MAKTNGNGKATGKERIAIVAGLRTPFAKQGTAYRHLSALDLGKIVVSELVQRAEIDPSEIGMCVFGQVVPSLSAPNIAREIVLGTAMPKDIEAYSVSRACATSLQAMTSAAEAMLAGEHDVHRDDDGDRDRGAEDPHREHDRVHSRGARWPHEPAEKHEQCDEARGDRVGAECGEFL